MTAKWLNVPYKNTSEYRESQFYLYDNSIIDIIEGFIFEFNEGYKILDDITKSQTFVFKTEVTKVVSFPNDYESFKNNKIEQYSTKRDIHRSRK